MEVIGFDKSDYAEKLIADAISSGRFPHAVLIEGGSPEKRKELARRISASLLCKDGAQVPCGSCLPCRKALGAFHPDVLFHNPSASSKRPAYSVDQIREIRDETFIIPMEADLKITVLCEAQYMSPIAQNAFLKILEEPPGYAVFILLAQTKSVFLPTIISRVTVYTLPGEAEREAGEISAEEAYSAAEKTAEALLSDGHYEIVMAAGAFSGNAALLDAAMPLMSGIFMNALRIKYSAGDFEGTALEKKLSSKLSRRALLSLIDSVDTLTSEIKMNSNLNLTVTRLCTLFKQGVLYG